MKKVPSGPGMVLAGILLGILPISLSAIEIVKVALILVVLIMAVSCRQKFMSVSVGLFLVFSCWFLFTAFIHFDRHTAGRLPMLVSQLLLFPVAYLLAARQHGMRLAPWALGGAALASGYALLQYLFGVGAGHAGVRAAGFLIHSNHTAQVLSSVLLFSIPLLERSGWKKQVLPAAVALLIGAGLLSTGSRAALIGFFAAFSVYMLFRFRLRHSLPVVLISGVVLFLLLGIFFSKRISRLADTSSPLYRRRVLIYRTSLYMGAMHLWTGVGPGRFAVVYRNHALPLMLAGESFGINDIHDLYTHFHAHNNFLWIFAVSGLPGLALLSLLLFVILYRYAVFLRLSGDDVFSSGFIFSLIVLCLVVQGLFDFTLFGAFSGNLFWFALGTTAALADHQ